MGEGSLPKLKGKSTGTCHLFLSGGAACLQAQQKRTKCCTSEEKAPQSRAEAVNRKM